VTSDQGLTTTLYLLASLTIFWLYYSTAKKISGPNLKPGIFWFFFALIILGGAIQLNVARHGYILFIPSSKDTIENNYLIRWIAFVSAILQTLCTPSKENQ
jgi:hypothetical protein